MAMDWNLEKLGELCKFCYVCKNHKEEMNCHCNRYASSFMLFWKSPLKKNLKPGSNVARNLMLMRQTLTQMSSHSFVSDSAHVKYIYHVWTGRKSICAPDKHCIYPYRHPSPAFLRWFLGRPQEDLEVPFILRKPVQSRATLLAESLNWRERLYEKKSWPLCPSKQRSCMLWLSKPALAHALIVSPWPSCPGWAR